ncbi:MAG: hypothetical protein JSW51_11585 [Gemmatimonadota bacterium]|nr:MAG: hypothetical protein JSW51_11585 [Gemmatimonadota bacterium]
MAQVYNQFRVLSYDESRGEMVLAWYDDTPAVPGPGLATPIEQQTILQLQHKIPVEAELNNWTRDQYLAFFLTTVEDVMDIPQWAKDEADTTELTFVPRVRIIT